MANKMLLQTVGDGIIDEDRSPDGAGYITICFPEWKHPKAMFEISVGIIPPHLLEPMKRNGTCVYATVKLEDSGDGVEMIANIADFELVAVS